MRPGGVQFDPDGDGKLDIYEIARAFRALPSARFVSGEVPQLPPRNASWAPLSASTGGGGSRRGHGR